LNRQGLRTDMPAAAAAQEEVVAARTGALRVLALGRADPTKGFERLVEAIASCQGAATLDLALSGSAANPGWMQKLHQLIGGNPQIRLHFDLSGATLLALFGNADLVAVPSSWMETGPLVVLEAFSQQVPVLGSRRGGIAELVKDGVDGWLVETESLADWTQMLMRLAQDRTLLTKARSNIGRVRTMARVAEEHSVLYQKLLANDTAHSQG
jgi:glycosyltransferase involved in cell wall biosynthesis